jgi:hypothetical protein
MRLFLTRRQRFAIGPTLDEDEACRHVEVGVHGAKQAAGFLACRTDATMDDAVHLGLAPGFGLGDGDDGDFIGCKLHSFHAHATDRLGAPAMSEAAKNANPPRASSAPTQQAEVQL